MDKLIEAFCKWEPIGQGLFLLFVLGIVTSFIITLAIQARLAFVGLIHGHPPVGESDDEWEDDEDDEEEETK